GCIILGVGIYLKVSKDGNSITEQYLPSFELMIAIGVIIMVLGFLGCCGAYRENRCMLLVFFVLLLIIFALLLAAGILAAVEEEWVEEKLKELKPLASQPQNVKDDLEKLQRELKCCGLTEGPIEWQPIPPSCRCNATAPAADKCVAGIYQEPCIGKITGYMKNHMEVSLGIAFAIAIILIFGMVFSMLLFCQIGKKAGNTV
uniref:Tetraspanin n=1 Tax=Cyprinodon variegatus TaxID=28743 RepID=A0A3Q2CAT3_CYPVA